MPTTPEHEALLGALQAQRDHVLATLDGLTEEQLRTPVVPSGWTPLAVVRHLTTDVERFWFQRVVAGRDVELPDDAAVWRGDAPTAQVLADYVAQARHSDDVVRARALGSRADDWSAAAFPGLRERDLRATVLHVLAETATHAGQLDVVRELVDGTQHLVLTDLPPR